MNTYLTTGAIKEIALFQLSLVDLNLTISDSLSIKIENSICAKNNIVLRQTAFLEVLLAYVYHVIKYLQNMCYSKGPTINVPSFIAIGKDVST